MMMVQRDSPQRRREILAAALKVMRRDGVNGLTTAAIAAEGNCSKETLYRWFGDRNGILAALVREQSASMNASLDHAIEQDGDVREALVAFGAAMLDLLTGEASVLINRAIISGSSRKEQPSRTMVGEGYEATSQLVMALLERAREAGLLGDHDLREVYTVFVGLIMGDRQIRALHGDATARPGGAKMRRLADQAVDRLFTVFRP